MSEQVSSFSDTILDFAAARFIFGTHPIVSQMAARSGSGRSGSSAGRDDAAEAQGGWKAASSREHPAEASAPATSFCVGAAEAFCRSTFCTICSIMAGSMDGGWITGAAPCPQ